MRRIVPIIYWDIKKLLCHRCKRGIAKYMEAVPDKDNYNKQTKICLCDLCVGGGFITKVEGHELWPAERM